MGSISQMINSIHEVPSRNGFTVPMSLKIGTWVICTIALFNFGATTYFMDVLFGHTHSIPKVVKTKPIPIEVIDKRPLLSGAIIEEMIPLELINNRISLGNDRVRSNFFPSTSYHSRVVLVSDAQSHCGLV